MAQLQWDKFRACTCECPYTVTELTSIIKQRVEEIGKVWIAGEILNLKYHDNKNIYCTIKDHNSQIAAVIWAPHVQHIHIPLRNGLEVLVHGDLRVYGGHGKYTIYIDSLQLRGQGALLIALENLKHKLASLGFFDPAHKKNLPSMPRKIGLVTSATGAAVYDIINVIQRRFPKLEILIYSVRVQGDGAAQEIADAIYTINRHPQLKEIEVLIVGRGGGSMEDLWAFNQEIVAKAIFDSKIPIISAVGHEIDITISDLVADRRALTPSEAGELVVPRLDQITQQLQYKARQLHIAMKNRLNHARTVLDRFATHRALARPLDRIQQLREKLNVLQQQMQAAVQKIIQQQKWNISKLQTQLEAQQPLARVQRNFDQLQQLSMRLNRAMTKRAEWEHRRLHNFEVQLEALSPLAVLHRGYSIAYVWDGQHVVTSQTQVKYLDYIWTRLADSWILSRVVKTGTKAIKRMEFVEELNQTPPENGVLYIKPDDVINPLPPDPPPPNPPPPNPPPPSSLPPSPLPPNLPPI